MLYFCRRCSALVFGLGHIPSPLNDHIKTSIFIMGFCFLSVHVAIVSDPARWFFSVMTGSSNDCFELRFLFCFLV